MGILVHDISNKTKCAMNNRMMIHAIQQQYLLHNYITRLYIIDIFMTACIIDKTSTLIVHMYH